MRYEFIIYQQEHNGKIKTFEMFHLQHYADLVETIEIVAVKLAKLAFNDHAIRDVKSLPDSNIIIPGEYQRLVDPLRIGNMVLVDIQRKLFKDKVTVLMNKDCGYQTYKPELCLEMGWVEIRREKRDKLLFHEYKK